MQDKDLAYIQLMGIPKYINSVLNTSLNLCYQYNCSKVNGVMILLAVLILMDDKEREERLRKCNSTYSLLISSFEYKVDSGEYGVSDVKSPTDVLHTYVTDIIDFVLGYDDNVDLACAFLEALNSDRDKYLEEYLEYTELDLQKLISLKKEEFVIPDSLRKFVTDTHKLVRDKSEKIENVDIYVDKLINVLCRKNKKNPCLVGEAGVGKTSIVEALVKRIDSGDVPECMLNKHVVSISSSNMIGGTKYRGDFEERMSALFKFASKENVILFLDEIHTFMGLGKNGDSSQSAGNNIKEYLSDGRISVIGTTTNKEWHKFIESDSALNRRLQQINVDEPSIEVSIKMIRDAITNYEDFHNVSISEESIESAVRLSDRYMKLEKLPDKAFKIIDQACATVKIRKKNNKKVTENDIMMVVSDLTGIELSKIKMSELNKLKDLKENIHKQLVGQENAINKVVKAVIRGKTGVADSNKPVASMLFVGPTGVGKTELCKILSKELFNSRDSFIRIDMSEFSAEYSTSKLIGSAPGYVGYGEGGILTEKVKKHPYSLVLLDEIEKANPKVFDSFLQVLDDGRLTDSEGQTVDFTNCIIIMTSNAGYGADSFKKSSLGFSATDNTEIDYNKREQIAIKELENTFRPEFLNRIDNIVIFDNITKEQSVNIAKLALNKLEDRLKNNKFLIKFDISVANYIADKGYSEKYGARNINRTVQEIVEDKIAEDIVNGYITKDVKYVAKVLDNNVVIKKK